MFLNCSLRRSNFPAATVGRGMLRSPPGGGSPGAISFQPACPKCRCSKRLSDSESSRNQGGNTPRLGSRSRGVFVSSRLPASHTFLITGGLGSGAIAVSPYDAFPAIVSFVPSVWGDRGYFSVHISRRDRFSSPVRYSCSARPCCIQHS